MYLPEPILIAEADGGTTSVFRIDVWDSAASDGADEG
jgi:hypothetical protein